MDFDCRHLAAFLTAILAFATPVDAQFRLPRFDVEIKGGAGHLEADKSIDQLYYVNSALNANVHAGAHLQLGQHIGIGWVYTRSVFGTIGYSTGNNSLPEDNIYLLMSGPDLRISTGRMKKWRPYLNINYLAVEFVEQKNGYRLASKFNSIGGGIGVMKKLSSKVYWNVLDLQMHTFSESAIYWMKGATFFAEARTGFIVNFGKRK